MSGKGWVWVVVAAGLSLTYLASRLLPYNVYLALVGVLIGAIISGVISWHIYQRSSVELKEEAEKLRKLHNATLNALPIITDGKYKVTLDEQGNFEKAEYDMRPNDSIVVSDSTQTKLEKDRDSES